MRQYESRSYKFNRSTVTLKFGDILGTTTQVIASSDDTLLTMSGGVSWAIRERGGQQIQIDAKKQLPADVGDVIVSTAGDLKQKYIFHCLTIDKEYLEATWAGLNIPTEDRISNIIQTCVNRCFQLMSSLNLESIAFPVIGTGSAHMSFKTVLERMAEELSCKLAETNKPFNIEVYIWDNENRWGVSILDIYETFAFQAAIVNYQAKQLNGLNLYSTKTLSLSSQQIEEYKSTNHDVFISYKREEADKAFEICDLLKSWNLNPWIDKDGIFSSYDFKETIEKAIENTKVVIFMSSTLSNQSEYVKNEIKYAITLKKILFR